MGSSRITYTPRPDATPETEAEVLAAVYRFLLDQLDEGNSSGTTCDIEKGGSRCNNDLTSKSNATETSSPISEVHHPGAADSVAAGERSS